MTELEFLAFLLFDDGARAVDLAATFTERRAAFLIEAAMLRAPAEKRLGFIYLLKYQEATAINHIYNTILSDPTAPAECSHLAERFRREWCDFQAICYELNMEALTEMREAGIWD